MVIISIVLYVVGFLLAVSIFAKPTNKNPKVLSSSEKIKIFCFGGLLILLGWCAWPSTDDKNPSEDSKPITSYSIDAFLMSQEFIKKQLKAPATAKFPDYDTASTHYSGDSTYIINSYLDAENSFGALLRDQYYAKIRYEGDDKWLPLDVHLIDDNQ